MPSAIVVYTYDELNEEAKTKARDSWRDTMGGEDPDLNDRISEDFRECLKELGLPEDDVRWSLSWRQGDGVAFSGTVDLEKYAIVHKLRGWGPVEEFFNVTIANRGRYFHHRSMEVELEEFDNNEHLQAFWTTRFGEELVQHIKDKIQEVSKELEKSGYDQIEYHDSTENIEEEIKSNEWTFMEDGFRIP